MAAVLRRTRLAAHLDAGEVRAAAGAVEHGLAHARHGVVVPAAVHARVFFLCIKRVELSVLDGAHHMRHHVVAAVRHGGGEVGNLERGGRHLALSDGDGNDCEAVPRALVRLVVVGRVRNHAAPFAGEVNAQLVAVAHGHHVVLPLGHRRLHGAVFALVVEHAVEVPAEVGVARGADGGHQVDGRGVAVAAHVEALVVEAVAAGKGDVRVDDTLLQSDERLGNLER